MITGRHHTDRIRILTLLTTGLSKPNAEREAADECPRASLYQQVTQSDMLYEEELQRAPLPWRLLYRVVPIVLAQSLEAYRRRGQYDLVLSWSDPHALLFALLLKLTRARTPHLAMMFWISKKKKAVMLRRVHSHIDVIILWTSKHKDFAINELGIPESKIRFIPYYVDQQFWRPMNRESTMICSVGVEMRDYPTLLDALRGLPIHCHIAAGRARGKDFHTVEAIDAYGTLPPNVTVGSMSPVDLRNLYARSRFVVIPLLPSNSDNGLTSILEAMAMGKAVICSRTEGQIDVIDDGVTGLYVPQGDASALRHAIQRLWSHPEIADEMGRRGRAVAEQKYSWDGFVDAVRSIAEEVCQTYSMNAHHNVSSTVRNHATRSPISA